MGKTNKRATIIPLRNGIDTKLIFGMNNPKIIQTKNAEKIKNLSIFLNIIGAISIIAAIKPIKSDIK